MKPEPVVIQVDNLEWETWRPQDIPKRGVVNWKTLISGDRTASDSITMGFAQVPPGERLHVHRHMQAEVYFILEGSGAVRIDGKEWPVRSGNAIFIPGNAEHGIANPGTSPLQFIYVFATDSFADVHYIFD